MGSDIVRKQVDEGVPLAKGSLQRALPHPVNAETEQKFLEILERKMTSAVLMYVEAVRAIQEVCGSEAWETLRDQQERTRIRMAAERGAQATDNSLRAFCTALEQGCRGSHEWVKVEDSDTRQAYRFTHCLWANVFRSLGAEDIGFWICEADGPIAAAFNPRIRVLRTETLMEGNDCCDHVYYTDGNPYERMSESTNQRVGRDAHSPVR